MGLANSGYYHWLTEDLPSFLINNSKLPILEYSESNSRNREIYKILNFQTTLVPEWVVVQNLSFTTRGKDLGYLHPEYMSVLKRFALEQIGARPKGTKKLYISRTKSRRSLPNEQKLEVFLETHGYEIIYSEEHSFSDQVRLFSEATSIIAPHGAGLTNALWADKARILEIDSSDRINRCFEWQSKVCNHEFTRFRLRTQELDGLLKFLQSWLR
jgi:capsular polysaccharide biosynthesis protein